MSWIQLEGGGRGGRGGKGGKGRGEGGEGEWQPEATWFQEPDPSAPTFAQYLPLLQSVHTLQNFITFLA